MPRQHASETRQVSHYELLERVGVGGMGAVYRARDERLDRIVALKFLHPGLLDSEAAKQRFLQEARAISHLNHPNIAIIHAIEEHEDEVFLVFEYLPGGTLRSRIENLASQTRRLSPELAATYGLQLAEALAHAHAQGIIHRDVKPANALFTSSGQLKLTDFGLAKFLGSATLTQAGAPIGTPAYMSPEQVEGKEIDERSDIFCLGAVLYELVSGRLPFDANKPDLVYYQILHQAPPAMTGADWSAPADLQRIVYHALEKDPAARFQSMAELAASLRAYLGGVPTLVPDSPTLSLAISTPRPKPRRLRRLWLAVPLLVAAIATAWFLPGVRERFLNPLPATKRVALLPFTNCTHEPVSRAFCEGLLDSTTGVLSLWQNAEPSLAVTPASEVRSLSITTAEAARKFAGANLAVSGQFTPAEKPTKLTLRVIDTQTQRVLRSASLSYNPTEPTSLQERAASSIAGLLGLSAQTAKQHPVPGSPVPAANTAYLRGVGYLRRYDLADNVERAIADLKQAAAADPGFAAAHVALSAAYRRRYIGSKDPATLDAARAEADRALSIDEQSPAAHAAAGAVLALTGDRERAAVEFRRALSIDPLNVETLRDLANLDDAMGRTAEALDTYQKAIQLKPDEWVTYGDLGVFYYRHQNYNAAADAFLKEASLVPDSPLVHRNLGGVYLTLGRNEDAEREFLTSIRLTPTVTAYLNLGALYVFESRYKEAVDVLEKATQLADKSFSFAPTMWANLGDAYRYTPGERQKSEEAYRKAIEAVEQQLAFEPSDPHLLSDAAVYRAKLGERGRALDEIAQALRYGQGNRTISFHAALVYELTGERERALAALGDAIRGGYSLEEINREPEFANLRRDPRYQRLLASAVPQQSKIPGKDTNK
jgi:serine/threonine protein kinase/Flp pilus assembly protein TadD